MPTVQQLFPRFCAELEDLVGASNRPELAAQLSELLVVSRCECGDANCAHFFTAARSSTGHGPRHSNLVLNASDGLIVLDVVDDQIVAIEVLDLPDVKELLDAALPLAERPDSKAERDSNLPCAACGFLTMSDSSYGSYNMCELCDWEDDGVQLSNPACGGGANHESLIEAQAQALARFPLSTLETRGIRRSSSWRPLNELEQNRAHAQRTEKNWMNRAVVELDECYWMR